MRLSKKALEQFNSTVKNNILTSDKIDDFARLYRLAKKLHRTYEIDCNGCSREKFKFETWKQYDRAREEQLEKNELEQNRVEEKIRKLCNSLGIEHYLQRDPRGLPLYLSTEKLSASDYNRNSVCIG